MLDIHRDGGPDTKVYFSHSVLPKYIDPQNVSTKKKPFATFNAQPFSHTLDLVLPEEIYELVKSKLEERAQSVYAKVYMKLDEVLEGDFFEEYIKRGNIMMLSAGRPLVDNIFSLYEGILRLELDRPTYERCGLQGTPIEDGGQKHKKNRWVVEYDLRQPSMAHGKKGFGRLVWAAKNVLNHNITWLFFNLGPSSNESLREGTEPISKHHPKICAIELDVKRLDKILIPGLTASDLPGVYASEDALALHEYLSLVFHNSPRVYADDRLDPHLSRYEVPTFDGLATLATDSMVRIRWRGLIPPQFVRELFLLVRKEGWRTAKGKEGAIQNAAPSQIADRDEKKWVAWSAAGFGGRAEWTVMQWAGKETLIWECEE